MKRNNQTSMGGFMIAVAALFLAGFLMLVFFGAQSYRSIVDGQEDNMRTRALLSYISTCVMANDTADAVTAETSDLGTVLTVADGSTGYGFLIYLADGRLMEEYAPLTSAPTPEKAREIGRTARFDAELSSSGLLTVHTDAGRVLLRLRSEGGGSE